MSREPGREQNWYPISKLGWFTGVRGRRGERGSPDQGGAGGERTGDGPMEPASIDMGHLLMIVLRWLLLTWDEVASGHWLLSSCGW